MKMIKITTDLKMTIHEFPSGNWNKQNKEIRELIGNNCGLYEHVMPVRLYRELHHKNHPTKTAGQCVSMLIDEEGLLKEEMKPNLLASYLYETDKHNNPIMGNVLFVGEKNTCDGIEFCGIEESVFKVLELQLNNMIYTMKAVQEVLGK